MLEKLAFEIKSTNAETICNLLSILKVLGGIKYRRSKGDKRNVYHGNT